ncbi:hypothetical protein [Bacillus sp. EB600]|uniref:hypothetical protein n=1 Tax=Bacillus sp. EB600 TaxID=2806345 RepID=UPI00210E2F95|nr:hypothetical protein [Bacillus sp. EB600]MCQ6281318.1 hypothetical protein [Bacillus sp. EB600]
MISLPLMRMNRLNWLTVIGIAGGVFSQDGAEALRVNKKSVLGLPGPGSIALRNQFPDK